MGLLVIGIIFAVLGVLCFGIGQAIDNNILFTNICCALGIVFLIMSLYIVIYVGYLLTF